VENTNGIELIGAGCILTYEGRWVFEVQKPGKWVHRLGQPPRLGLGCIGGTLEPGETAVQALQREAGEEICSQISLRSAQETIDISPTARSVLTHFFIEGLRPAMIWEAADEGYFPGLKVAVFLGEAESDPTPGDLPAIVLGSRHLVPSVGSGKVTVGDLGSLGAEIRARQELPLNGRLQLQGTLRFLYDLRGTQNSILERDHPS